MAKQNKLYIIVSTFVVLYLLLCSNAFAKEIIQVKHNMTIEEIIVKHRELTHTGFEKKTPEYEISPRLTAPYSAGKLKKSGLDDALNSLKMVRFLAGVPYENVKLTDELNDIAQHGAVLLAATNQFTHSPGKPADMTVEFYKKGEQGCKEANINAGRNSISNAVIGFVFDAGQGNITNAGHRRWVLKPGGENFGMGFVKGAQSYGGYRINMYVYDGKGPFDCEADSYVAWPNAGAFPLQYFADSNNIFAPITAPWSINLGEQYSVPSKKNAKIKLTRKSDGKEWIFDFQTPDLGKEEMTDDKLHFSVDNDGYGMGKALIFRPDIKSLGVIADGESFNVEVSGIKYRDGSEAVLSYDINFFDLESEQKKYDEYMASLDVEVILPPFAVTMNGVKIDNTNLEHPFIMYNNITYFPMTYFDSRFLGIGTNYTAEDGLSIFRLEDAQHSYNGLTRQMPNEMSYPALKSVGKIRVNEKEINNRTEEYPILFFRDITYFPMTWKFCVDEFGWGYSFDFEKGLVINTVVDKAKISDGTK
ncbi:MAG: hypothetical protein IKI97_11445 [Clostridia bacterium]|nr:hypothetical protein [Clostridia bacterium]